MKGGPRGGLRGGPAKSVEKQENASTIKNENLKKPLSAYEIRLKEGVGYVLFLIFSIY